VILYLFAFLISTKSLISIDYIFQIVVTRFKLLLKTVELGNGVNCIYFLIGRYKQKL